MKRKKFNNLISYTSGEEPASASVKDYLVQLLVQVVFVLRITLPVKEFSLNKGCVKVNTGTC
jgi:hypothetical protein